MSGESWSNSKSTGNFIEAKFIQCHSENLCILAVSFKRITFDDFLLVWARRRKIYCRFRSFCFRRKIMGVTLFFLAVDANWKSKMSRADVEHKDLIVGHMFVNCCNKFKEKCIGVVLDFFSVVELTDHDWKVIKWMILGFHDFFVLNCQLRDYF